MAAELLEAGVDVPGVYRRLYEDMTIGKLALLGIALDADPALSTTASWRWSTSRPPTSPPPAPRKATPRA